jgi:DNA ligase 1
MNTLPTLYKKTSTGADQYWTIGTEGNVIVTRWGQVGGAEQETRDLIKTGKNIGKKNETTAEFQASLEAQSQWEKKLKKGYVKDLNDAREGKVDAIIEGGISPMLAHRFDEQGHKIKFPALAQPKFDGHRCIAVVKDGKATLWSRTRKPITGVPHIIADIEAMVAQRGVREVILDGELYNHDYKDNFEDLTSFIRQVDPKPGHEVVQYHVYDIAHATFHQGARLGEVLALFNGGHKFGALRRVETIQVDNEDELMLAFEKFLEQGYEGLMVRNALGAYVNKRSYDLQKVKEFADAEFKVVGVEEGRGKLAGHAIFVCVTGDGTEFRTKMKGETSALKKYFDNPELAVGKMLTVKYQGFTNKAGVPRFPVALRFREDV